MRNKKRNIVGDEKTQSFKSMWTKEGKKEKKIVKKTERFRIIKEMKGISE